MKKETNFRVEYEFDKETGQVVAFVPELNHLSSFGSSFPEAEANIKEAILGYLEVLVKEHKKIPKSVFKTEGTYLKLMVPKVL